MVLMLAVQMAVLMALRLAFLLVELMAFSMAVLKLDVTKADSKVPLLDLR